MFGTFFFLNKNKKILRNPLFETRLYTVVPDELCAPARGLLRNGQFPRGRACVRQRLRSSRPLQADEPAKGEKEKEKNVL